MARYFLHLRDGTDELLDAEGIDVDDLEAIRTKVLAAARGIIADDVRGGIIDLRYRIDAESEDGTIVYTLPFEHAFSIVPRTA